MHKIGRYLPLCMHCGHQDDTQFYEHVGGQQQCSSLVGAGVAVRRRKDAIETAWVCQKHMLEAAAAGKPWPAVTALDFAHDEIVVIGSRKKERTCG